MRKFITFVPVQRNDGSQVSQSEMFQITEKFLTAFGGATLSEPAQGMWIDESGKVYCEPVRQLMVAADESRQAEFRELVIQTGKQLGQLAMFFEMADSEIEIIPMDQQ